MKIRTILAGATLIVLALSGCSLIQPTVATAEQVVAELNELQALIPTLEAGLAVANAKEASFATASSFSRAGIKTVNSTVVFGAGLEKTPRELMEAATELSQGWARYPDSEADFLENFYGTEGNEAVFYVIPYDTDDATTATIFLVRLYIYPTFSTTINYIYEEYLVANDTTWALVDTNGDSAPLSYLANQTVYFDGTVEERTIISNNYSNGLFYDILFDDSDNSAYLDATSSLYNFPTDAGESSEPTTYDEDQIENEVYSVKVTSTIEEIGVSVIEYYTETSITAGVVKSAVSYVLSKSSSNRNVDETTQTVRRYIEYPDGKKIVRARSETTVGGRGNSKKDTTVTEVIDIARNSSGLLEFSSTATTTEDSSTDSTEIKLTETAVGSGAYEGTSTTTKKNKVRSYTVALTSPSTGDGVMIIGGEEKTQVSYPVSRRSVKDIIATLESGGSFNGRYGANRLQGLYTAAGNSQSRTIEATLAYIYEEYGGSAYIR